MDSIHVETTFVLHELFLQYLIDKKTYLPELIRLGVTLFPLSRAAPHVVFPSNFSSVPVVRVCNRVTDRGAKIIERLVTLHELNLRDNPLSGAAQGMLFSSV